MAARHRSPFGARPRRRAILVLAAVSSMKISRVGSRSSCPSNHASRAAFTSSRCCSAACAVFFKRDAPPFEETPERTDADADVARLQLFLKFDQRDVRRLGDRAKEKVRLGFNTARLAVAALPLGRDVALLPQTVMPADRARRAHPKSFRRLAARKTTFNSIHHAATKIDGQSFGHACRPPSPARILNQNCPDLGIHRLALLLVRRSGAREWGQRGTVDQ